MKWNFIKDGVLQDIDANSYMLNFTPDSGAKELKVECKAGNNVAFTTATQLVQIHCEYLSYHFALIP